MDSELNRRNEMEETNDQFIKEVIILKTNMEELLVNLNAIINNYFTDKSGLKDGVKLQVQLESYRNQLSKMKLN
jgi:hypothetical protein|tara:strand:- start:2541 stop:2762 length:222 start_codon:yes stop_codon:yes gene_type:complete